jgi:hypothetical protein
MSLKLSTAGLTDKQAQFLQAYIQHGDVQRASITAGYSTPQTGYGVLRTPNVQKALHDMRSRLIATEGATLAYQTLLDLLKPTNPGNVRLGAAKYLMDAAGHGAKPDSAREKSLQDMTADELAATIAKLDQALADRADGAKPVPMVIDQGQSA